MHVTQGTFSLLPDFPDEQILRELAYALARRWAVSIEHTDDPHRSNVGWETWGAPTFAASGAGGVMEEVKACRVAHPDRYVKVVAFDAVRGCETVRLALFVQRPRVDSGFELVRRATAGSRVRYALRTVRRAERRAS